MKKIITLCFGLMAALTSWAQGFVFQYQGQTLADGATVIIAAEEDLFGDLTCETNSTMNPSEEGLVMKLLSWPTATVNATLEVTYNTLDADVLQWCMGGNCQAFQNSLTKQFTMGSSEKVQFDAIAISSEGYLTATLKATIGLESHQVNIVFTNGDDYYDGIREIKNEELRMNNGVYDLNGRRISAEANSSLKKGMYIVTDGKHTRKVAIK